MGLIAIGDIHGCAKTLDNLLQVLAPAPNDHLVFVGDYADRGPDTRGVVNRCLTLARSRRCTFLRGNHEHYVLEYLAGRPVSGWDRFGGLPTLASYADRTGTVDIPTAHVRFFEETKLYLDEQAFFFVHAGLLPERSVAENMELGDEEIFLFTRKHLRVPPEARQWEKTVVCGHTPVPEVINEETLICIDTGCVWSGRLSAIRLPERDIVSVPNVDR